MADASSRITVLVTGAAGRTGSGPSRIPFLFRLPSLFDHLFFFHVFLLVFKYEKLNFEFCYRNVWIWQKCKSDATTLFDRF